MMRGGEAAHDALCVRYAAQGYVVVPDALSIHDLSAIARDIVAVFSLADASGHIDPDADIAAQAFHDALGELFQSDFDAYLGAARLCNHAVSLHRLGSDPGLVALLQSLGVAHPAICARPVVWFHSPRLARSPRYHRLPAHQEWSNMQGSIDGMVVWFPLMQLTPDMGLLQVVPGSHLDGLRPLADAGGDDYPLSMAEGRVSDADFVEVDVPPGAALLFSPFLIHRSGTNTTRRARITANFRYNNAADPSFIARHMINPFTYEAPVSLATADFPPEGMVRGYFEALQQERG